jgi:Nucleotidyltransferase/DNA polymerase involved in DNA repair
MSALNPEEDNYETRIVMHVDLDSFYASVEVDTVSKAPD